MIQDLQNKSYLLSPSSERRFFDKKVLVETACLIPLIVLLWSHHIFADKIPLVPGILADLDTEWHPFAVYKYLLSKNHFPLWNPGRALGMPFLGFIHTSAFYPFSFLYYFLPFDKAFLPRIMLHQFIFGAGIIMLLRFFGTSRLPRLLGGFSAVMGGWINYAIYVDVTLNTMVWFPLVFLFILRFCKYGGTGDLLLAGLLVFLQLSAGDVETIVYEQTVIGIFLLASGGNAVGPHSGKLVTRWVFCLLIGCLLVSYNFLPGIEYVQRSVRQIGVTENFYSSVISYNPKFTSFYIKGLLPRAGMLGNAGYVGFATIFFALYGLVRYRPSWVKVLAFLAVLSVMHPVLMCYSPVYFKFFYHLPLLGKLRVPYRSVHIGHCLLVMLAATGLEILIRKKGLYLTLKYLSLAGIFFGIAVGLTSGSWFLLPISTAASLFLQFKPDRFLSPKSAAVLLMTLLIVDLASAFMVSTPKRSPDLLKYDKVYRDFFEKEAHPSRSATFLENFNLPFPAIPRQNGILYGTQAIDSWISVPLLRYARLMSLIAPGAVEVENGRLDKLRLHYLFKKPQFLRADNFHLINLLNLKYMATAMTNLKFSSPFSLLKELRTKRKANPDLPKVDFLERNGAEIPSIIVDKDEELEWVVHVSEGDALVFSLGSNGKSGKIILELIPKPDGEAERLGGWEYSPASRHGWSFSPYRSVDLSPWAGKKVEIRLKVALDHSTDNKFALQKLEIVNPRKTIQRIRKGKSEIYLNGESMPRSYLVHEAKYFADEDKMLAYMKDRNKFKIREEILLPEKDYDEAFSSEPARFRHRPSDKVETKAYREDMISQTVTAGASGFLALTDTYYPGWKCFVDGEEKEILLSNYNFRAVRVKEGEHEVVWRYEPASFRIGLWVSITSVLCLVGIACIFPRSPEL